MSDCLTIFAPVIPSDVFENVRYLDVFTTEKCPWFHRVLRLFIYYILYYTFSKGKLGFFVNNIYILLIESYIYIYCILVYTYSSRAESVC